MTLHKTLLGALGASALLLCSCHNDEFRIQGEISGAADESLVVERADYSGEWLPLDSVRTDSNGHFSIYVAAPDTPEIYRLALGDKYVYFPISERENLTLESTKAGFGISYKLTGSLDAERMAAFDLEANALPAVADPDSAARFKRKVFNEIIMDARGNIVSYYVLTKMVNGVSLYNPADKTDAKYYAAVATQFQQYKPDDPHSKMLEREALKALGNQPHAARELQAEEISMIEIELTDTEGQTRKLSDIIGKGKPVAVIFSVMNDPQSPEVNSQLARAYNRDKMEFVQVSFDDDQYAWRDAARNLPWVNLFDPAGGRSAILSKYNVTELPTVVLYNRSGELAARVDDLNTLSAAIAKL